MISLASIRKAKDNLKKIINSTPLQFSQTFTDLSKAQVFMKPECLQKNGSFKIRGAYTMLHRMADEEKARGVVTFSAGNWAQGVAYAASMLNIKAVVILPEWCNQKKIEATKGYGAEVVIYGRDSQELLKKTLELHEQKNYVYINPFSNINMMAGTAAIGIEIIEEKPDTEIIVVPIGGGALIAGIAMGAKHLKPEVKIYGVQPFGANAIYQSLKKGDIVEVKIETIADGLAVSKPDKQAVKFVGEYVDEIILVTEDEIKRAIYLLLERAKLLVEPAGATAMAGVFSGKLPDLKNKETVVVLTGGNIDLNLLKEILESNGSHQENQKN